MQEKRLQNKKDFILLTETHWSFIFECQFSLISLKTRHFFIYIPATL